MSPTQTSAKALDLEDILRQIEAEPSERVRVREQNAFDEIAGPLNQRLVLFGAGHLGKSVLAGLRRAGVEPLAFADNRIVSSHREVMGLPVFSAAEAVERYGRTACFVVTIYHGSAVRNQLLSLGCPRVSAFAPLLWKYADIFIPQCGLELPHRFREQLAGIRQCYATLADDVSRREVREQLMWRYWLDDSALSPALDGRGTYFPLDLLSRRDDEVFADCGGFDGDTIRSFSEHWGGRFRHAFPFEPDPVNRAALAANVEKLGLTPRVTVMPYAVGNTNGTISFASSSSAASHVTAEESGTVIQCRRLDDIDWPVTPTYIKMDIESAEPEAIAGAAELLRKHHPVLAICTYHRSEHLWQIPNLIRSIAPEYNLFLRRYAEECWEGVCYAIPPQRLQRH